MVSYQQKNRGWVLKAVLGPKGEAGQPTAPTIVCLLCSLVHLLPITISPYFGIASPGFCLISSPGKTYKMKVKEMNTTPTGQQGSGPLILIISVPYCAF